MSCNNWCNSRNFKTKKYDELSLHTLIKRRWRSKLTFFYKMVPSKHSSWWRRLEDVFKMSFVFVFRRRLDQNQYNRLGHTSSRRLQDVFKTSSRLLQDVLPRLLQDVLQKRLQDIFKTSSRRFQDVFKTFSRRVQDIFKTYSRRFEDFFKTSSRRLANISSRRFQDVIKLNCSC